MGKLHLIQQKIKTVFPEFSIVSTSNKSSLKRLEEGSGNHEPDLSMCRNNLLAKQVTA